MSTTRADRLDALLPQTQCTRCGYPDCRAYAEAMASGEAQPNRCPPGGEPGAQRLAAELERPALPLDVECGTEGPRQRAVIDVQICIGCTLCITACPVDAIAGAPKRMHAVLDAWCTGCALCLPPCPVDCIRMVDLADPALAQLTGPNAWLPEQAATARQRYARHKARLAHTLTAEAVSSALPPDDAPAAVPAAPAPDDAAARKAAVLQAALARARQRG